MRRNLGPDATPTGCGDGVTRHDRPTEAAGAWRRERDGRAARG
ncbi:MAG: hypothetical protein ACRYG8_53060 [Janthinobacterium lividum]